MKLKIPFYKNTGEQGEPIVIEFDGEKFKTNPVLISQAIHVENNHTMVKPGQVKTKGLISGGGRKPWKQKGTGRARAGSSRSPLWRGGGITFGPTGENKILAIPKKMKEKAFKMLLIEKIKGNDVAVIENISLKIAKTKFAEQVFGKISPTQRAVLALEESDFENTIAWRNLGLVEIKTKDEIKLNDLNSKKKLILSLKAFESVKSKVKI